MANIINNTILVEGTQKAVLHWYFESDGNEGELINRTIFDPSNDFNVPASRQMNYETGVIAPAKLTILQLWSSMAWWDFTLSFDGLIPEPKIVVARDSDFHMDYRGFGGMPDPAKMENIATGKLLISTKDFAPLGSSGFLVLEVRKS